MISKYNEMKQDLYIIYLYLDIYKFFKRNFRYFTLRYLRFYSFPSYHKKTASKYLKYLFKD